MSNDEYSRGYAAGLRELDHSLSYGAIEKIQAENAALKQEIEKLTGALAGAAHIANITQIDVRELRQEIEQLKAENERLKEIDERECLIAISIKKENEQMKARLKQWDDAALIPCTYCDGSGFSGHGTGYDDVCDGCAGGGGNMGRIEPADISEVMENYTQLKADKAALLECVKWYADDKNYKLGNQTIIGERARAALSELKGGNTNE